MRTKIIAVILLLLILAAPCTKVAYADTDGSGVDGAPPSGSDGAGDEGEDGYTGVGDTGDGEKEHKGTQISDEVYYKIKASAEARRDELLYLFERDLPPEILNSLQKALTAMRDAEDSEDSDRWASAQNYLSALKYFRNTWSKYLNYHPDAAIETLKDVGGDDNPGPGDTEPPEVLESQINGAKKKLLLEFQERFMERIVSMSKHIEELMDGLTEDDARKAKNALEKSEQKIQNIVGKIEKGDYDEAIDDFSDNTFGLEDDFDYLEDKDAAKTLKTIDKLQVKVFSTLEKKQDKEKDGENASEEDTILEELNGELDKVKKEFKARPEKPDKPKNSGKKNKSTTKDSDDEDGIDDKLELEEDKLEDELEKEEDKLEDELEKEEDKLEQEEEKEEDK